MSLFGRARREAVSQVDGVIPPRGQGRRGAVYVDNDSALRHSAMWACTMLRAGLMSTFPVDTYVKVGKSQVEVPKPPVLIDPGGEEWPYCEWVHATEVDLCRAGNTIGLITKRNGLGLPDRIELAPISKCVVRTRAKDGKVEYQIDGKTYQRDEVWHERRYRVAGLPVGLSPIAYAAWSIGEYLSMQDFALDWFGGGGVPKASLKNTEKSVLDTKDTAVVRDRWNATVKNGDLFVHGKGWEYKMMQAEAVGMEWLEGRRYGLTEICRFMRCPADLIDAAISAPGTLTYASMSQRNLQFLIMQLNGDVVARETAFSKLAPGDRFVKLNPDSLLRMDPETRSKVMNDAIKARRLTPDEAREKDNMPPLTAAQEAEFVRLFGEPGTQNKDAKLAAPTPPAVGGGYDPIRVSATVGPPLAIGSGWESEK